MGDGPEKVEFADAAILIVDDEPHNRLLLEDVLEEAGYRNIQSTGDARQVVELCRREPRDILLLDLMMPHLDGFEVMEQLAARPDARERFLPILMLTADISVPTKQRALRSGAHDFLPKPFDHTEVLLRIHNLLSLHFLHEQLRRQNQSLEERVQERTRELEVARTEIEQSQFEVIERLAHAAEYRDDDTGRHTQRVGHASALVAAAMGLPARQVELLRRAAPLHDAGKIGIPDSILLKPGKLTDEEFDIIKTHTNIGANLLSGGRSELVQMAELIALSHHERMDSRGYPAGVSNGSIPVEGRIVAVVDVFDALTHERPYKKAWPVEQALDEIRGQSNKQFCPHAVAAFLEVVDQILAADASN